MKSQQTSDLIREVATLEGDSLVLYYFCIIYGMLCVFKSHLFCMVLLFYFSFIYLGLMVSNTISILDDVRVVYINSNTTDVTRGGRSAFPSILEHLSTQP
jgi:hypothetical protein